MRRLTVPIAIVVFSVAILGVVFLLIKSTAKEQGGKTDGSDLLDGTWRSTETEYNGKTLTTTPMVLTFRDETCTTDTGDGDPAQSTYRIDTSHKPPRLERVFATGPSKGETVRFLYQIEGDTLRLAVGEDTEQFPQGFNDHGVIVTTYKRVK